MTRNNKRVLAIAMKLGMLFEGREWQKAPSKSQEAFQQKMLNRAKVILAIADDPKFVDDEW